MSEAQPSTSNSSTKAKSSSARVQFPVDNSNLLVDLRRTKSAKHRRSLLNQFLQRFGGRPATMDLGTTSALPSSIGVDPPSGSGSPPIQNRHLSLQIGFSNNEYSQTCQPDVSPEIQSQPHSWLNQLTNLWDCPSIDSSLEEEIKLYLKYGRTFPSTRACSSDTVLNTDPASESLCSVCCLPMYDITRTDSNIAISQDLKLLIQNGHSYGEGATSSSDKAAIPNEEAIVSLGSSLRIPIVPINSCFSFCPNSEHQACLRCWREHISTRISSYQMHKMPCVACRERVEFPAVRALLHLGFMAETLTMEGGRAETQLLMRERAEVLIHQYDRFILQLALAKEPDTRWCPRGGCGYAVIASNCENCPDLYCLRPGCFTMFCYHCREFKHSGKCKSRFHTATHSNSLLVGDDGIRVYANGENDVETGARGKTPRRRFRWFWQRRRSDSQKKRQKSGRRKSGQEAIITDEGEVKNCPRCQTYVVKANDGTCNHMSCVVCGCEFCWLCLREVNDMHYLSVSGCTFWGKKQWRPEKRIFWQFGTLLGAPIGVGFLGILAIPAIIFGLPILAARRVYNSYKPDNKHKRRFVAVLAAFGSFLSAPLVAALVVGLGVPTILAYVYVVMPFSMIRSCSCWSKCCFETYVSSDEEDEGDGPPETHERSSQSPTSEANEGSSISPTWWNTSAVPPSEPVIDTSSSSNRVTVDVELNQQASTVNQAADSVSFSSTNNAAGIQT